MNKKMARCIILIILGIILFVAGFFIDQAKVSPPLLNILAPKYSKGKIAYGSLVDKKAIVMENLGFYIIANMITKKGMPRTGPVIEDADSIQSIRGGQSVTFMDDAKHGFLIFIKHHGGESTVRSIDVLRVLKHILEVELNTKRMWCFIVALIFMILNGVGEIIDLRGKGK